MNDKKTIIENFAEFAYETQFDDIPERVVEKIKLQIITSVTAVKFSDWHPEALKVYKAEKNRNSGNKNSTVIALNKKMGAEEAAVVNAAYAMSLDFDDYMLMGHMGYSSVLTPLAFLENRGSLKELITAAAVCNEIMGRLSLSCFFGPLNGQMWSYIHNIGAAAAIAKIKKFDRVQMANAMSLALYQPNFCLVPGFWNDGSKLLTASIPLRTGIQAALYAGQGLEGAWNIIEGHLGFMHFFSFYPVKDFTGDLGDAWLSDTLSYKRYPGTSYIGAPVDSSLCAMKELGFQAVSDIEEIKKVEIDTTFLSYSVESLSRSQNIRSLDPIAINFSVRYSAAYALLRGDLKPEFFREDDIKKYQDDIFRLAEKIEVRHDWEQSTKTLQSFPQILQILLRIKSGQRRKMVEHFRALNRESKIGMLDILSGIYRFLFKSSGRSLVKSIFKKKKRISLLDLNLPEYMMLQSAKAKITLKDGRSASSYFPIPTGGAGIDLETRKEWVAERYQRAFNKDFSKMYKLMDNPETKIALLVREWMKKR